MTTELDKLERGRGPLVRPHPDVIVQPMGDSALLLQLKTDRFFELNRTGARLWELLRGQPDPALLMEQLAAEFEVAPAELEAEIVAMLAALHREQLVELYARP